jgi:hypothetical protein
MRIVIEIYNGEVKHSDSNLIGKVHKVIDNFIKEKKIANQIEGPNGWEVAWCSSVGLQGILCKINVVEFDNVDSDDLYFINSIKRLISEMGFEVWIVKL